MTIDATSKNLTFLCASGDGTMLEIDAGSDVDMPRFWVHGEPSDPSRGDVVATLKITPAEMVMLGAWLVRAGEAFVAEGA